MGKSRRRPLLETVFGALLDGPCVRFPHQCRSDLHGSSIRGPRFARDRRMTYCGRRLGCQDPSPPKLMTPHKSSLALALGLVLLGVIAWLVPRPSPVTPKPVFPFQARPIEISWQLDKEFEIDDGQVLGELRNSAQPEGGESRREPVEKELRQSVPGRTGTHRTPGRAIVPASAIVTAVGAHDFPVPLVSPCPPSNPFPVASSSRMLVGQPWPPGQPLEHLSR